MTAQPQGRQPPALASEAQVRFVLGLTEAPRLEKLTAAEARFLIGWLRGPPRNMSRAQQLYIAGLVESLGREQVQQAIDYLRGLAVSAATPSVAAPTARATE
jgi:hypothetical protein